MMIKVGNFLFRYRNGLFPLTYALLLVNHWRILDNDLFAALIGFAVALLGQVLRALTIGLAYIVRGGRKRRVYAQRLVTEGMFAHCRNPLYLGNLLIITGVATAANSLLFVTVGLPLFLFAYLAIIAAEEDYLRRIFGQEYFEYCRRVNRIIPNFSGFGETLRGRKFNWNRLVVKEYGSTFAWSAGMILVVMKNTWQRPDRAVNGETLWILEFLLAFVTLAFGLARYLKKSRILCAE